MRNKMYTLILGFGVHLSFASPALADAEKFQFDGVAIGKNYLQIFKGKSPWNSPCDNDPIDSEAKRLMIYLPIDCKGHKFPDKTAIGLYLPFVKGEGDLPYNQKIQNIVIIGGKYFEGKTNFDLKLQKSVTDHKEYKETKKLGTIESKGVVIEVHKMDKDI